MNIKYLIIAIVGIVVIYGVFSFGKKMAVAPEVTVNQEATTTVPTATTTIEVATTTNETKVVVPTPAPKPVQKPKTTTPTVTTTPKTTESPTILKDGSYLISYTQTGFTPARVEIKKGQSVHFVNNSDKAMSISTTEVGSLYFGELSQGKSVGRGGTYDFTFTKTGAWTYMNRNVPLDSGVIIVQE